MMHRAVGMIFLLANAAVAQSDWPQLHLTRVGEGAFSEQLAERRLQHAWILGCGILLSL